MDQRKKCSSNQTHFNFMEKPIETPQQAKNRKLFGMILKIVQLVASFVLGTQI